MWPLPQKAHDLRQYFFYHNTSANSPAPYPHARVASPYGLFPPHNRHNPSLKGTVFSHGGDLRMVDRGDEHWPDYEPAKATKPSPGCFPLQTPNWQPSYKSSDCTHRSRRNSWCSLSWPAALVSAHALFLKCKKFVTKLLCWQYYMHCYISKVKLIHVHTQES